ncbi:hypothetical protein BC937DRAFT_92676 [Endogone sp. FLAS-F59071]|nr:hypothetical protein BC937DRAFT_92676 [Endogone sp. FLAS-F59071]|eukprot:RUS15266.1 hypothetical protein BC937DRAFT_92676 [Endogone sp. FLAS-F59071]
MHDVISPLIGALFACLATNPQIQESMCGRVACAIAPDLIKAALEKTNLKCTRWIDQDKFKQSYNVPPTSFLPVVRKEWSDKEPKWGLIPSWSKKQPDYQTSVRTTNARDDSLTSDKPMFNGIKGKRRCVVVVQGFYEWLTPKQGGKHKKPYFTRRKDDQLMLLAGLYDIAKLEDQPEPTYSYVVVTTSSSPFLSFLHERMPVILENGSEDVQTWLDPAIPWGPEVAKLLKSYEGELECYPVKHEVGKVGTNSPEFILPLSETRKSGIDSFFQSKTASDDAVGKTAPTNSNQASQSSTPVAADLRTDGREHFLDEEDDSDLDYAIALERALRESREEYETNLEHSAVTAASPKADNRIEMEKGDIDSEFSSEMERALKESQDDYEINSRAIQDASSAGTTGHVNREDIEGDADAEFTRAMEWALRESQEEHERVNNKGDEDREMISAQASVLSTPTTPQKRTVDASGYANSPTAKKAHMLTPTSPSILAFSSPPASPSRARVTTLPMKKTSPKKDRKEDGSAKITSFFQKKP